MSNLFEQYERASSRSMSRVREAPRLDRPLTHVSSGFLSTKLQDDEVPIFSRQRINFRPPETVTHLLVCNNFLVMAMAQKLFRLDLERPDSPDELSLASPAAGDKVYRIFLDPTGRHLIINMAKSQETYYLSRSSKKPKNLVKLRGMAISAIGWNKQNASENSTAAIIVGTIKGILLEVEIQSGDSSSFFQQNLEQYSKQLISLGEDQPITAIEFERMPSSSKTEYKYFILVTTPGRLYQYVGTVPMTTEPPMFQHVFQNYENLQARFQEIPGDFGTSELKLYYSKYRGQPTSFAWMTGPGIYYGKINTSVAGNDNVTMETRLMQYPESEGEVRLKHPLSIILTEFHVLVLYADRMRAMCVLNEQFVFDDFYDTNKYGKLLGLCQDPLRATIWAYTETVVFKYKITHEARDVWQMYLDKGEFDLAKEYCKDNPVNLDKVLTKQAEQLFLDKKYHKSATIYAMTQQNSFEEIVLRFIQIEDKEALKHFLHKKLFALQPNELTQQTMLVTWLVEIYLNCLGELRESSKDSAQYDAVQDEFRKFLAQTKIKKCVQDNRDTIYQLVKSHGDVEDMIYFAVLMHDFEVVIDHHLQQEDYQKALEMIKKQPDIDWVYKFSPILMQNIPKQTVDLWIELGRKPDPKKLIPALVQYDPFKFNNKTQGNEAARYLEFAIKTLENRDQAIHNYLLLVYTKLYPNKLMNYLEQQGQDAEHVCYDVKYALRLCLEHDLKEACVHIYTTMALYEEAVELALQVDVELAKKNADMPQDDEELKKKLWLRIARHVVEKQRDIKRAMEFLQESDLLKIEDILPFFPDFVTIDHFKDAICTSLQEYNKHIESLQEDMNEATESAKSIRTEIHNFRNKFAFIQSQDKCCVCHFALLTRSFYVFPCMHKFHTDCLINELLPHLSISKRNQVEDLQRTLTNEATSGRINQATKIELEDMVASECVYCGEMMIRSIDQPFVDVSDYQTEMNGWL